MVSMSGDHPLVLEEKGVRNPHAAQNPESDTCITTKSRLEIMHERFGNDHPQLMLFGNSLPACIVRYQNIIHAFEVLLVRQYYPSVLTYQTVQTLRQLSIPDNWDFEEWDNEMINMHKTIPPQDIGAYLSNILGQRLNSKKYAPCSSFNKKKMREDVFFFMMLCMIPELRHHWLSRSPVSPPVHDPDSIHMLLMVNRPECYSIRSMIYLMLCNKRKDDILESDGMGFRCDENLLSYNGKTAEKQSSADKMSEPSPEPDNMDVQIESEDEDESKSFESLRKTPGFIKTKGRNKAKDPRMDAHKLAMAEEISLEVVAHHIYTKFLTYTSPTQYIAELRQMRREEQKKKEARKSEGHVRRLIRARE